tara:strand:- start:1041 stop:1208 length:168 start_codon:yes stop_codon:yes gene_type:complete
MNDTEINIAEFIENEASVVQPSYKALEWLSGHQARAIKEVEVAEVTDLDQELNFY